MKRVVGIGLVALLVFTAAVAVAQPWKGWKGCGGWCGAGEGGYGRMYDPAKVETVSGEVVSVQEVTPMRKMGPGISVTLKTGSGDVIVHLGPQWYIERLDVKITAGDKVDVKGVKAVRLGQNILIAGEVKKGEEVLKLRDENGIPFWAGWRQRQAQ